MEYFERDILKSLMKQIESKEAEIHELIERLEIFIADLSHELQIELNWILPIEIEEDEKLIEEMNRMIHALASIEILLKAVRTPIDKIIKR